MSTREDRIVAASFALQGLLSRSESDNAVYNSYESLAADALAYADALLKKIHETTPDPDA